MLFVNHLKYIARITSRSTQTNVNHVSQFNLFKYRHDLFFMEEV
jgi:hypothetical protein